MRPVVDLTHPGERAVEGLNRLGHAAGAMRDVERFTHHV